MKEIESFSKLNSVQNLDLKTKTKHVSYDAMALLYHFQFRNKTKELLNPGRNLNVEYYEHIFKSTICSSTEVSSQSKKYICSSDT